MCAQRERWRGRERKGKVEEKITEKRRVGKEQKTERKVE